MLRFVLFALLVVSAAFAGELRAEEETTTLAEETTTLEDKTTTVIGESEEEGSGVVAASNKTCKALVVCYEDSEC